MLKNADHPDALAREMAALDEGSRRSLRNVARRSACSRLAERRASGAVFARLARSFNGSQRGSPAMSNTRAATRTQTLHPRRRSSRALATAIAELLASGSDDVNTELMQGA